MSRRVVAVGILRPWREADFSRYMAGEPLRRAWDIRLAEACVKNETKEESVMDYATKNVSDIQPIGMRMQRTDSIIARTAAKTGLDPQTLRDAFKEAQAEVRSERAYVKMSVFPMTDTIRGPSIPAHAKSNRG